MRAALLSLCLALGWTAIGVAQPPVTIRPPVPSGPPALPPIPGELPAPPDGFNVGVPVSPPIRPIPGAAVVEEPVVRPPAPVSGAIPEEPPGPRIWVGFEYLLWKARGADVPPMLTAGNLGQISPDNVSRGPHSGFRLSAGYWIEHPRMWAIEAAYTFFARDTNSNLYQAAPGSSLSRPFIDANSGSAALFQLAVANATTVSTAQVRTSFDSDGFELNVFRRVNAIIGDEAHIFLGPRYWNLEEELLTQVASRTGIPAFQVSSFDQFTTQNRFFGGQIGTRMVFKWDRLSLAIDGKFALGAMFQETEIRGGSTVTAGPTRIDRPGGLLALPTNIGDYERSKFAYLRESSAILGYRVTDQITVTLGYNMLTASNVVRPGHQIDPVINTSQLPFVGGRLTGAPRPIYRFDGDSFWMHGVSLGLAFQF